ncbi:uncharacterized protein LOC116020084 [Ipomoea triloba]|uniref:uncharacterized protein LOC116007907 n=1 Tax=Ipomoea triloba TaxID=35885 RepID=UPI00125D4204|nr:uncharacterized protein LOC116007907 [Ipomoea triloba]XP_031116414.1 uncharacterized protein LOC116020084 [Ipomoea triloba]
MAPSLFCCCGKRSASSAPKDDDDNAAAEEDEGEAARDGPVVVELFSSQGCATSPEAELLFSRIGRGDFDVEVPPLVLLAFHVDYWDYTGWKDPFGCSQWTVRQKGYVESLQLDTMFTPLLVVQSQAQCVGNDQDAVLTSIKSAPRFPPLSFQAKFEKPTPETLEVSLTGTLRNKVDSNGVNIMVVLLECGLVTQCEEGENKGKVLANDYVVRRLEKLCEVKDISGKKTLSETVKFSLWESFNSGKCGMAVFMENGCRHILGSQKFQLPNDL